MKQEKNDLPTDRDNTRFIYFNDDFIITKKVKPEDFFKENRFLFEANIKFRFRNMDQFSSINLANHLEKKRKCNSQGYR